MWKKLINCTTYGHSNAFQSANVVWPETKTDASKTDTRFENCLSFILLIP